MTSGNNRSFIGKYVCFANQRGSFTWGRINDEAWYNLWW